MKLNKLKKKWVLQQEEILLENERMTKIKEQTRIFDNKCDCVQQRDIHSI